MIYELKDGLPEKGYCDDPLFELFSGSLNPEKYLKNENDINEVNDAICVINDYLKTLKDRNLLES